MKKTLTAAALATLMSSVAFAQAVVVTDYREIDDDAFVVQPWGVTVDALEDMDVYGVNGEEIGDVEEVLVDTSGQVVGMTVEAGGFLGIGDKEVVVPLGDFTYADGRLTTALTEEALEALPEWND
jgi:opacity protein-like surface antigen